MEEKVMKNVSKKQIKNLESKLSKKERKAINNAKRIATAPPTVTMRHKNDHRKKQRLKMEIRLADHSIC